MILFYLKLTALLLVALVTSGCAAFTPPSLGIGAVLFPVRGNKIAGVSESPNQRMEIVEASDFFVDAFWTNKVGGGARQLTDRQRRQLEQSQTAEFTKRYGGRRRQRRGRESELLICRNKRDEVIACVGVEVDRIPDGALKGPTIKQAPLMSNLAVSRKYRRRGLAEELVAAVENLVRKQWGYEQCYLYVEERNRAAIKLYRKLGYRKLWRDDSAKTLLPKASGDLDAASTVIVCMGKDLNANFFQRIFQ